LGNRSLIILALYRTGAEMGHTMIYSHDTSPTWFERWPAWLRWVCVLPAAVCGMILLNLCTRLSTLGSSHEVREMVDVAVSLFRPAAFVYAGVMMAPRARRAVAVILAVVYLLCLASLATWMYVSDLFGDDTDWWRNVGALMLGSLGAIGTAWHCWQAEAAVSVGQGRASGLRTKWPPPPRHAARPPRRVWRVDWRLVPGIVARWFLVLPAAIGAWIGSQFLVALISSIISFFGDANFIVRVLGLNALSQLCTTIVGSYWFVRAGAATAPTHRFATAIVLSALHTLFMMWALYAVMSLPDVALSSPIHYPMPLGLDEQTDTVWWALLQGIIALIVPIAACVAVYRGPLHVKKLLIVTGWSLQIVGTSLSGLCLCWALWVMFLTLYAQLGVAGLIIGLAFFPFMVMVTPGYIAWVYGIPAIFGIFWGVVGGAMVGLGDWLKKRAASWTAQ